jgi:hypothetical protein
VQISGSEVPPLASDVDIAVFAESVELTAVTAYALVTPALSAPAAETASLFLSHHQAHAESFAALSAGKATGKPNAKLMAALTPALSAIKDEAGGLELVLGLEQQLAETYAFALTLLVDKAVFTAAAAILPIESAHAGVLAAALGKPVDAMFPTGAFLAAEVGDGTDVRQGLDPDTFPAG